MKKKTGKIAVIGILSLVILFHLLTAVMNGTGLGKSIGWFPLSYLSVESGSMEPELSKGDLLLVWETPWEELEPGDIITFHQGNELVTHKLLRREGDQLITKGTANRLEDSPVEKQDYCARVILKFSKLAIILEFLTTPLSLICAIILLTALFYGKSLTEWIISRSDGENKPFRRGSFLKLMTLLTVLSFFAVTPFMTAAKYVASVNVRTRISAGGVCLSSNCLSREGDSYSIIGWAGGGYGLTVKIQSFENQLRFNPTGTDVDYGLYGTVIGSEGSSTYITDYTMSMSPLTPVTPVAEEDFACPASLEDAQYFGSWTLRGNDSGGISDAFAFQLALGSDVELEDGDQIRFRICASTPADDNFQVLLSGDYLLTFTTAGSFIDNTEISGENNSSLLTYTIQTKPVEGGGLRNVKVSWLPSQVYLNETQKTAGSVIASLPSNYHPTADTDGYAYLILPMQPYSNVSLEFFKYDVTAPNTSLGIQAVDMTEQE